MSLVSVSTTDRIAVVTIDNPPVSTGNASLRSELYEAFTGLRERSDIDAVVLRSAQAHFYSGSDIREFDGDIAFPSLPQVIDAIGSLEVPVVAALNGLTLGGGLEFALASDARIAAKDAKMGLPEVTLGMFPGAGGTVRLPRLIGVPRAIDMIASGRPVTAEQALDYGLLDGVTEPENLLDAAMQHALTATKRRADALTVPHAPEEAISEAAERGTRSGKARPNILQAVELIRSGAQVDGATALAAERAAFDQIRVSREARNLRYLFFAKRAAAKDLAAGGKPRRVTRIGVAGAGTMGAKIAAAFLGSGAEVVLYELAEAVRDRALAALSEQGESARKWGTLAVTADIEDLASCELVIDAVFEDMDVKRELLVALEDVVAPEAVLASNTSYLDLDELSAALRHPERFVGLHFFNPADRNQLLEVVRTAQTGSDALAVAAGVARGLGKTPILAGVADGFVANRVYADYRSQAEYLVEDGASPREVDDAMRALGLPIGPFAVADMSGLDIAWARRKRLAADRNPEQRYVSIADTLCEQGRLGKKTGAGWYRYDEEHPRGADDPVVDAIISEARTSKGIEAQEVAAEAIQQRIICAMIVAAAGLVETGIAQRASDIDVALTAGFAFPAWLGGPLKYGAEQSEAWLIEGLAGVHASDPIGFAAAADAAEGRVPAVVSQVLDAVR